MSAKFFVVDSGNATRKVKTFYVIDSGGVARKIKKGFVVDSGGVTRKFYSAQDDLVFMPATVHANTIGYEVGGGGSMVPNILGDGARVRQFDVSTIAPRPVIMQVDGFGADPGAAYLTTVTVTDGSGNIQFSRAGSVATYQYGAGVAQWTWASGFVINANVPYAFTVVRNN